MTSETIDASSSATLRVRNRVRDRGMLALQYGMAITAIIVAVLLAGAR